MKNMKKLFAVAVLFSLFLPQMVFASAGGPKVCGDFGSVSCDIRQGVKISGEDGVIKKLLNCDYSDCEKYSEVDTGRASDVIINKAYRASDAGNINIDWENGDIEFHDIELNYLFRHIGWGYG